MKRQAFLLCCALLPWLVLAGGTAQAEVIELDSNPSTGYSWRFEVDPEIVAITELDFEAAQAEEDVVGAGGQQRFEVTGLQPGEARIAFVYQQDWAPQAQDPRLVLHAAVDEALEVTLQTLTDTRPLTLEGLSTSHVTLRLQSNRTTGFAWTLTQEGDCVSVTEQAYEEESPGVEGAGGVQPFAVESVGEGPATLTFTYAREWEAEAIENQIVLSLSVDDQGAISLVEVGE